MFCLLILVPVLILMCVETYSISQGDGEHKLKERDAKFSRPLQPELLDHLDKAAKHGELQSPAVLPFQVPTDRACAEIDRPSYAKATCTSYPGRIVCQLGRYTFVINNGEHKMNPEIIERFAAMVYHRSQEGDSDFDVSVDIPVKINEDYFVIPQKMIETTTAHVEEMRYPVFVECYPIPDDRKMCNPPYTPTEVIYSCKRRELGFGGYGGGLEKRMVISVDREGTVSAGDLRLPYNALIDRRMKRQKEKIVEESGLVRLTPSGTDNKLYSDVCSFQTKGWCPNFIETDCPPTCRTENQTAGDVCEGVNVVSPSSAVELPAAPEVPMASLGGNVPSSVIQPQVNSQRSSIANLTQEVDGLSLMKNDEAELYAVSNLPPPQVRVYSDICQNATKFPWCPPSIGDALECSIPTCVTEECVPPTTICRQRREQPKEKKPAGPLSRLLQNRMRASRKLGPKRIYRKRKRQAHIARFSIFGTKYEGQKKQDPENTKGTPTKHFSSTRESTKKHHKTSTESKNTPQDTCMLQYTTTPQSKAKLPCCYITCHRTPESRTKSQGSTKPEFPTTQLQYITIPDCPTTELQCITMSECPTTQLQCTTTPECPTTELQYITIPECPTTQLQCTTTTECPTTQLQCTTTPEYPTTQLPSTTTPECPTTQLPCITTPECPIPECLIQPQGSTIPECPIQPQGSTIPECPIQPQGSTIPECPTQPQGSTIPECPIHPQGSIKPECPTQPQCSITPECPTIFPSAHSATECFGLERLGFNRFPLFKREMRRRRKNPIRIQWPNVSRERYILE